jgi:RNA polymerase sigma factor CnrH
MLDERTTPWSAKVESVYNRESRQLWARLYAQCCDAEQAFDALQEAFMRLQQQNGTPIHDVRAWLYRVGRNWLVDAARRKKNAARSCEFLDGLPGSSLEDPSNIVEHRELQSLVRQALAELPPDDREVLVLRYALGWSSHRIAEVLSINRSAVDMRMSRARRRLADQLEKTGLDHEPT